MGEDAVYRLTQTLPYNKNYKLFFYNYFLSIPLLELMKKNSSLAVATLRKDRLKGAAKFLKNEKELKKKSRASSSFVSYKKTSKTTTTTTTKSKRNTLSFDYKYNFAKTRAWILVKI